MYYVSAKGVDERMINVHYYYYINKRTEDSFESKSLPFCLTFFQLTFSPACIDWSAV